MEKTIDFNWQKMNHFDKQKWLSHFDDISHSMNNVTQTQLAKPISSHTAHLGYLESKVIGHAMCIYLLHTSQLHLVHLIRYLL